MGAVSWGEEEAAYLSEQFRQADTWVLGLVAAARRPIEGAERVAALLIRAADLAGFEAKAVWLNGSPAGRIDIGGDVTAVSFAVENSRITRIYAIRNPHKLARLDEVAALTRS